MATTIWIGSLGATGTAGGVGPFVGPSIVIRNMGRTSTAWLGLDDDVAVGSGFPICPGEVLTLPIADSVSQTFYTITGSGDGDSTELIAYGFQES